MNATQSSASAQSLPALPSNPYDSNNNSLSEDDQPVITKKVMKEMISSYLQLNTKLMDKICQLQQELQTKNSQELHSSFHEDYSIMNTDFNEIEEHIKQYKLSLTDYQQKVQAELQEKNQIIEKMNEQVSDLTTKMEGQSEIIEQLQLKNAALQETQESLVMELQQMQIDLREAQKASSSKISRANRRNTEFYDNSGYFARDFGENVQAELQRLINKLMKELEYEQSNKKKLSAEIKRLQVCIIDLEKEIIDKNNKIYSLELKVIKNSKPNPNITIANIRQSQKQSHLIHNFSFDSSIQNIDTQKTKRKDNKSSITLQQLLSDHFVLKFKEKIYLCIRLIQTYIDKLQKNDLTIVQETSISIHNFATREPHLYAVRLMNKNSNELSKDSSSQTPQVIVSNLFNLMQMFFRSSKSQKKGLQIDPRQNGVILLLSNAKKSKKSSCEDLSILRQTLEQLAEQCGNEKQQ